MQFFLSFSLDLTSKIFVTLVKEGPDAPPPVWRGWSVLLLLLGIEMGHTVVLIKVLRNLILGAKAPRKHVFWWQDDPMMQ